MPGLCVGAFFSVLIRKKSVNKIKNNRDREGERKRERLRKRNKEKERKKSDARNNGPLSFATSVPLAFKNRLFSDT